MIEILIADISTLDVDAIVNAANSPLHGGSGVDGAIHRAAGPELVAASMRLAPCPAGEAVITPGFQLTARHVIHAVGPIWTDGQRGEQEQLKSAYDRAFEVALAQGTIRSIAFPAISTGAYGFPPSLAAMIAISAMRRHEPQFDRIIACAFNADTEMLYRNALDATPVTPG